ncbi:hypothetical protein TrispH2_004528, partial [Trichoplax sp. H2]
NIENDIKDRGDFISTLTNICDELTENVPQDEKEKIVKEVENLKEQYILTKESSENKKSDVEEAYEVSNDFEEIYKKLNSKCEEIEETELVRQEMAQVKLDESDMCLEKCKELENAIDSNDELLKNLESKIEAVSGKDLEAMSNEMKDKLKRVKDRLEKADKVINTKENLLKDRKDKYETWNKVHNNAIEILDAALKKYEELKYVGFSIDEVASKIEQHRETKAIIDGIKEDLKSMEETFTDLKSRCNDDDAARLQDKLNAMTEMYATISNDGVRLYDVLTDSYKAAQELQSSWSELEKAIEIATFEDVLVSPISSFDTVNTDGDLQRLQKIERSLTNCEPMLKVAESSFTSLSNVNTEEESKAVSKNLNSLKSRLEQINSQISERGNAFMRKLNIFDRAKLEMDSLEKCLFSASTYHAGFTNVGITPKEIEENTTNNDNVIENIDGHQEVFIRLAELVRNLQDYCSLNDMTSLNSCSDDLKNRFDEASKVSMQLKDKLHDSLAAAKRFEAVLKDAQKLNEDILSAVAIVEKPEDIEFSKMAKILDEVFSIKEDILSREENLINKAKEDAEKLGSFNDEQSLANLQEKVAKVVDDLDAGKQQLDERKEKLEELERKYQKFYHDANELNQTLNTVDERFQSIEISGISTADFNAKIQMLKELDTRESSRRDLLQSIQNNGTELLQNAAREDSILIDQALQQVQSKCEYIKNCQLEKQRLLDEGFLMAEKFEVSCNKIDEIYAKAENDLTTALETRLSLSYLDNRLVTLNILQNSIDENKDEITLLEEASQKLINFNEGNILDTLKSISNDKYRKLSSIESQISDTLTTLKKIVKDWEDFQKSVDDSMDKVIEIDDQGARTLDNCTMPNVKETVAEISNLLNDLKKKEIEIEEINKTCKQLQSKFDADKDTIQSKFDGMLSMFNKYVEKYNSIRSNLLGDQSHINEFLTIIKDVNNVIAEVSGINPLTVEVKLFELDNLSEYLKQLKDNQVICQENIEKLKSLESIVEKLESSPIKDAHNQMGQELLAIMKNAGDLAALIQQRITVIQEILNCYEKFHESVEVLLQFLQLNEELVANPVPFDLAEIELTLPEHQNLQKDSGNKLASVDLLQNIADKISNRYEGNTREDVTNSMSILREKFYHFISRLDHKISSLELIQRFHSLKNELMINYEEISTSDVILKELDIMKFDVISNHLSQCHDLLGKTEIYSLKLPNLIELIDNFKDRKLDIITFKAQEIANEVKSKYDEIVLQINELIEKLSKLQLAIESFNEYVEELHKKLDNYKKELNERDISELSLDDIEIENEKYDAILKKSSINENVIRRLQELMEPFQAVAEIKSYASEKADKVKDELSGIQIVAEEKHNAFVTYADWTTSYKEKQANFVVLCEKIEHIESIQDDISNFELEYLIEQLNVCKNIDQMLSSNKDLLVIIEENGQKLIKINRRIEEAINEVLVVDKNRFDGLLTAINDRMEYIQDAITLIESFENEYLSLKQWLEEISSKIADKNNVGVDVEILEKSLEDQQFIVADIKAHISKLKSFTLISKEFGELTGSEGLDILEAKTKDILSKYKIVSQDASVAENCVSVALENCMKFEELYTKITNILNEADTTESVTVNLSDFNKKELKKLLEESLQLKTLINSKEETLSHLCDASDVIVEMNSSDSASLLINRVNQICDRHSACLIKITENCSKLEDMWNYVLAYKEDVNNMKVRLNGLVVEINTLNLQDITSDEIEDKDSRSMAIAKEVENEAENIRSLLSNGPSIVECLIDEEADALKIAIDSLGANYMSAVKTITACREIFPQSLRLIIELNINLVTIMEFCTDVNKSKVFQADLKSEDPKIIESVQQECKALLVSFDENYSKLKSVRESCSTLTELNPDASSKELQSRIIKAEDAMNDIRDRLKKKDETLSEINDAVKEYEQRVNRLLELLDSIGGRIPKEFKLLEVEVKYVDCQWEKHDGLRTELDELKETMDNLNNTFANLAKI